MIRACDGHRGHGEGGCGWRSSGLREADGDACPLCGGVLVEATVPAPPVPQRPVAGWVYSEHNGERERASLYAGDHVARVWLSSDGGIRWLVDNKPINFDPRSRPAPTLEAAQLAAEDALRAVLIDAAAALGLRVVP